jgi:iron complex transport system ATP-binding protein
MPLIAEQVSFSYGDGPLVLDSISLALAPGKVIGLYGPNGCGKTTLLRCLNGHHVPCQGRISCNGIPIDTLSPREIARQIAVVPQAGADAEIPLTVQEMVMTSRFAQWDLFHRETPADRRIVDESLERVGLASLARRPLHCLSGGERQRTLVARALAQQARILLLDEPGNHLDLAHVIEIYHLCRSLAASGYAILLICHDLFLSPGFVDEAILLDAGRIAAAGNPATVLSPENLQRIFRLPSDLPWPNLGSAVSFGFQPRF